MKRLKQRDEPEEKRRPTLADRFLARRWSEHERAVHPRTVEQLQRAMRNAHRFVLTEDAVRRIGEVVLSVPDLLVREHQFARAPFDLTWIEFPSYVLWGMFRNRHPRHYDGLGVYGSMGAADHTIGYLIDHERINTIVGGTVDEPDMLCNVTPIQYRIHTPWSTDDRIKFSRRAGFKFEDLGGHDVVTGMDAVMWGTTWNDLSDDMRDEVAGRNTAEFLPANPLHGNYERWNTDGMMQDAVRACMGEIRNIIAVLLVLNRPSLTRYVRSVQNTRGFHRGKMMPFLSHTTVTIDLDARPTLRLIGTSAGDSIPRRRHEVRGHYCHDEESRLYSRIAGCIHEYKPAHGPEDAWEPWPDAPPGVPGDPGCARNWVCSECGGRRWWMRKAERGDSTRGFVVKDGYDVDTRV